MECLLSASQQQTPQFEQTISVGRWRLRVSGLHSGAEVALKSGARACGLGHRLSPDGSRQLRNSRHRPQRREGQLCHVSLMRQGVLISTTEHLLSALIGLGVDNVIVEVDNLEVPILDGSARAVRRGNDPAGGPQSASAANASTSASSKTWKCAKVTSLSASIPARATRSTTPSTSPRRSGNEVFVGRSRGRRLRAADRASAHVRLSRR